MNSVRKGWKRRFRFTNRCCKTIACSSIGFGRGFGSFRMEVETSGFGAISATSTRSSRLDLWVARAKSSSQLASVRCGAITAIKLSRKK